MEFFNVDGKILKAEQVFIRPDNHSYRYGDGLFETMKVLAGKILLIDLHFERLSKGLSLLQFHAPKLFTRQGLEQEISDLCKKNNCEELARVRLSVSRGNGGLYDSDEKFQYIIECWPLQDTIIDLNRNAGRRGKARSAGDGLMIDIFPDARKSCDIFSNLKSANFLPYIMASLFAKENKLDDCLVMNVHERICDATIANIFWIKDEKIFTPPLSEGCVAGVMRRHLIESTQSARYKVQERVCELNDLEQADEVFLTNVITGIRPVKQFRKTFYLSNDNIYDSLAQNLPGNNIF